MRTRENGGGEDSDGSFLKGGTQSHARGGATFPPLLSHPNAPPFFSLCTRAASAWGPPNYSRLSTTTRSFFSSLLDFVSFVSLSLRPSLVSRTRVRSPWRSSLRVRRTSRSPICRAESPSRRSSCRTIQGQVQGKVQGSRGLGRVKSRSKSRRHVQTGHANMSKVSVKVMQETRLPCFAHLWVENRGALVEDVRLSLPQLTGQACAS